ncbi:hypothetical protein LWI28_022360 [Acer negundo]|uniref:Uncharacterized protein n=1 Tax=Acer negundo TaxID=4023 RepID=A0AAD5IGQ4_ACENE|nr:hypothetical protein LWI28_022360 [Acer negundo]
MGCFACFDGDNKQQRKEQEKLASVEARARAADVAPKRHLDSDCGVILDISSVLPSPKESNKVALGHAKKALFLKKDFAWMNGFPSCVTAEIETEKIC